MGECAVRLLHLVGDMCYYWDMEDNNSLSSATDNTLPNQPTDAENCAAPQDGNLPCSRKELSAVSVESDGKAAQDKEPQGFSADKENTDAATAPQTENKSATSLPDSAFDPDTYFKNPFSSGFSFKRKQKKEEDIYGDYDSPVTKKQYKLIGIILFVALVFFTVLSVVIKYCLK